MRVLSIRLPGKCASLVCAIFLLHLDAPAVIAQSQPVTLPALNEQSLSRFAETWSPISEAISRLDKEFDGSRPASLVDSLTALAEADGAHSALDDTALTFGYNDFEFWAAFAARAIVAAQWASQPPTEAELERTIAALHADPDIPADQKQSLINDVSAAFQTALANKPSDSDIAAAKAVLPLLKPIITPSE